MRKDNQIYSMQSAAEQLGIKRPTLFKFLRRYNFIVGNNVQPEFILLKYFVQYEVKISKFNFSKKVQVVRVTGKGLVWLKKVYELFKIKL